jgi:hypothetical protein
LKAISIFARYRHWKHLWVPPLLVLGLLLMNGEPDDSPRWWIGTGLALVLGLAYVTEEVLWMVRNQGRPCDACGRTFRPKSFRLTVRCPHCGRGFP